jgi:hypothetical protein
MRQLKVWAGRYLSFEYGHPNSKQTRGIIAAYTKKQACKISNLSYSELTNYWALTGNNFELNIAKEVGFWVYDMINNKIGIASNDDPIVRIK